MAHIDALIDKITDPALRSALRSEVDGLLQRRSFGLVFQEHKPETVELPGFRVRPGCTVRVRADGAGDLWKVDAVKDGVAALSPVLGDGGRQPEPAANLAVVREFGEPIYPGLAPLGRIERGGDKPFHVVINGENYHALDMLLYAYEGRVDAMYLDPPYNTGAKDWKYNNDYVDGVDQYRHSKWLAFMQRRLLLAKRLLNPEVSVLVVTIDEKEVHHLGMLLEQLFPEAVRQMATIVINPLGQARKQELGRVEEYAFFVFVGSAQPTPSDDDLLTDTAGTKGAKVRWEWLLRGGTGSRRADRPNLFFPVYVDPIHRCVAQVGDPLPAHADRHEVPDVPGMVTVWPLRTNGDEGRWRVSPATLRQLLADGYAKVGAYDRVKDRWSLLYLGRPQIKRIQAGEIAVVGRDGNGAVILKGSNRVTTTVAKTVWNRPSHRAGEYGTALVKTFVPGRAFPFPKSLYAVEDTLRVAVGDKPNALVVDFFAGVPPAMRWPG